MAQTFQPAGVPAYTSAARTLHWVTAAFILTLIPLGIVMVQMPEGAAQTVMFDLHRSLGILVLPIVIVRAIYRFSHTPAPLPQDIPAIQRLAAETTHWLLYAALIVQPMLGWLGMSAYGEPIRVLWLFDVPSILAKNEPLSETLFMLHRYLGYAMAALLCAHIGGAMFHHFIRRDNVLMRMVSG